MRVCGGKPRDPGRASAANLPLLCAAPTLFPQRPGLLRLYYTGTKLLNYEGLFTHGRATYGVPKIMYRRGDAGESEIAGKAPIRPVLFLTCCKGAS